jgi:uncharacterized protein YbbC (DUF1343 family)
MLKVYLIIHLILITMIHSSCDSVPKVQTGLDRISDYHQLFKGKRIGIITNHTAYNSRDEHIIDIIQNLPNTNIVALFGPEHGIRGEEAAGLEIENEVDRKKNIPIYSLYGKTLKPTSEMLNGIEILLFDIQDIGARFYTYIYTMSLSMEAAAEHHIPFVVFDRPNPINGVDVEGNILEEPFKTFVGLHPIPVRHGMTIGELARMFNEEGWLQNSIKADLTVIPMQNWQRKMWYDQTGLVWRAPSPNMPDLRVATVYPGMCLFEGTNISEGRGTYEPFLRIGSPWFIKDNFITINKINDLPGVLFGPITFTPKSIPEMSPNPKYKNEVLTGLSISVTDRNNFRPYLTGIMLVQYLYQLNSEKFKWRVKHFDRLCGTSTIRQFIAQGKNIEEIREWIDESSKPFLEIRGQYLLY